MKDKIEQEQYCLQVKILCDVLRTKILMIDDFPDKQYYYNKLKKIKSVADGIYWKI